MFGTESPLSTCEDDGTAYIASEEVDRYYAFRLKMDQATVRSKGKCPECFSCMEGENITEFWECVACREDARLQKARMDEAAYCKGMVAGMAIASLVCGVLVAAGTFV